MTLWIPWTPQPGLRLSASLFLQGTRAPTCCHGDPSPSRAAGDLPRGSGARRNVLPSVLPLLVAGEVNERSSTAGAGEASPARSPRAFFVFSAPEDLLGLLKLRGDTWWRYSGMRARNGSNIILVVFVCGWLRWRVRPSTVGGKSSNSFGLSGGDTSDVGVWSCPRGVATRASGAPPAGVAPPGTRRPTPPQEHARQQGWGKSSRSPPCVDQSATPFRGAGDARTRVRRCRGGASARHALDGGDRGRAAWEIASPPPGAPRPPEGHECAREAACCLSAHRAGNPEPLKACVPRGRVPRKGRVLTPPADGRGDVLFGRCEDASGGWPPSPPSVERTVNGLLIRKQPRLAGDVRRQGGGGGWTSRVAAPQSHFSAAPPCPERRRLADRQRRPALAARHLCRFPARRPTRPPSAAAQARGGGGGACLCCAWGHRGGAMDGGKSGGGKG